jgi:hypothetical protein
VVKVELCAMIDVGTVASEKIFATGGTGRPFIPQGCSHNSELPNSD